MRFKLRRSLNSSAVVTSVGLCGGSREEADESKRWREMRSDGM